MKTFTAQDHKRAQEYELAFQKSWMQEYIQGILAAKDFNGVVPRPDVHASNPSFLREFFAGDRELWLDFVQHMDGNGGRTALEICTGSCGALAVWPWIAKRIGIDPLINEYWQYQTEEFERSVLDGMVRIAECAEKFQPELDGKIDGCIVARNSLDHCLDPWAILRNIGRYAAPGCLFLFWSEIFHKNGADHGHCDVSDDPSEVQAFILGSGFRLVRLVPRIQPEVLNVVEYGGVFVKE